ncbi:chemotaxis protein CheA, partial [Vibrio parahaemolyticus]|nr:chemotaxis protein CheA [Vibrio parahaemolyticus]
HNGIRRFRVVTTSSESELLDLFTFHVSREQVKFKPAPESAPADGARPAPPSAADPGYGFFENAPGAPQPQAAAAPAASAKPAARSAPKAESKQGGALDSTTIRVSVEKVDQL